MRLHAPLRTFSITAALLCAACAANGGPILTTLVTFNGGNGANPQTTLISDAAGNLYGATTNGGTNGDGIVFELSGSHHQNLTTLVTFNGSNGQAPSPSLVMDSAGNIYGATSAGGSSGSGTLFELSGAAHKTFATLVSFDNTTGNGPGNLAIDASNNLYGITYLGGGNGTVFQVSGPAHQTVNTLYTFQNDANGAQPNSLIADKAGNLYGTTYGGSNGAGTVYMLSGADHQTFSLLATLNTNIGGVPAPGGLALDRSGNLYGAAYTGGGNGNGNGTVYELSGADHKTLTTLFTFQQSTDGANPDSQLLVDANGNLFGATNAAGPNGHGTVYELSGPDHSILTTLYSFSGTDGDQPFLSLTPDSAGTLYGMTLFGGGPLDDGTIFQLTGTGFAVPEPNSLTLLATAAPALLYRRRKTITP